MGGEAGEQRVDEAVDEGGEAGAGDGVQLKDAQGGEGVPAPVAAPVEVAEQAEAVHDGGGDGVVRQQDLAAAQDKVADGHAVPPAHHVGPEALVREAPRRVRQRVAGRLEVHEDLAHVAVGGGIGRHLVGVVQGGEAAEARLDVALRGAEGHAQVGVEVGGPRQLVVGLVQRVQQVRRDDEDVDAAAVLEEARAVGRGLRVARSYRHRVVYRLDPGGGELWSLVSHRLLFWRSRFELPGGF